MTSLQPTIILLWDQFSDYEAPVMATLRMTLAAKVISGFTFNSQIPEALNLQSWCVVNADKLRELPPLAAMYTLLAKSAAAPSLDLINIIDLPSTVEKPKRCNITLKAYMYNYARIAQCRFHVHSMTNEPPQQAIDSSHQSLALPPPTPSKDEKLHAASASGQPTEENSSKKLRLN
ncbi:hypothetical protein RHSIM_Rhsim01G0173300 [Rhododendron simsii]|uniref:Uncharacterized protein n=1 Tax=Rhododendron simsii TaxID=118357 RepID=A0A834HG14_RHOSS|nr:hypothetical protein RHSIM_Rhsim01G0173300 [Rhododendron simsii]